MENRPNSRDSNNTGSLSRTDIDYKDRDNLKLFPSRSTTRMNTLEKPLLINNGDISSANGRSGVALNQCSQNGISSGTTANGNRTHYQRLRPVGVNLKDSRKVWRKDSFKVIAFICGSFAVILLIMGLSSTEWLIADRYRQGLFMFCVEKNVTTIPFDPTFGDAGKEGCHRIDWNKQGYTLVAAAFFAIALIVDIFATGLTALGLRCHDPNRKYKYYRVAVYVMAFALVACLVALVIYPVCFAQIMDDSKRTFWEFGWAYGVGWGASIFLFGGVILLLCDKESEEIYYKERTIVYTDKG